ncbi:MAG: CopG family transcriptional regulator [Pseudomonadota bacterium]|nr:CopG family transcriptional regulator [Pseudomonadota bacterium]
MRTTLAIDDDILATAKHLAERDQKTLGEVISALARQGLARPRGAARAERNGVPLLPSRKGASPVTPELVEQLRDELP